MNLINHGGRAAYGLTCLLLAATATAQAPDGGPWAPTVLDLTSLEVSPRDVTPGEPVIIRLRAQPQHASRLRRLHVSLAPAFVEPVDVSQNYNADTGLLAAQLPAEATRLSGVFQLRLLVEFEWTDGRVYQRSPPLGTLTVRPAGRSGSDASGLPAELTDRRARVQAALVKARQSRPDRLAVVLAAEAERLDAVVTACLEADDTFGAQVALAQFAELAADDLSPHHPVGYRLLVEAWLRDNHLRQQPALTMMNVGTELTASDVEAIRRVGFNTILHSDPTQLANLREHGFRTGASTPPARLARAWAASHPQAQQQRYLLSRVETATADRVTIDLMAPYAAHGFALSRSGEPHRYWRVRDLTAGLLVLPTAWTLDPNRDTVTIAPAQPGHRYQVAFLVYAANLHFFGSMLDPVIPAAKDAMHRALAAYLDERSPHLDVYRPTSLYYPFPSVRASDSMAQWNFWGYQWGAGPEAQARFNAETGLEFDPEWLTDGGRYGHINYPPRPEYLAWMAFQQRLVKEWASEVVALAHEREVVVRPFWGDHWIGMEPHLDFFAATGVDEIVKACSSAQTCRLVTDIPADVKKIIRFSPWLSHGELFRHPDPVERIRVHWAQILRGALFCPPDGLSWGGETLGSVHSPALAETLKAVTDEYRLVHQLAGGSRAYRHPLKVYVLNAWGKLRPWPDWGQINPSQAVLTHLTDVPVDVAFVSLAEVGQHGVPADATVLLNVGEPGSAWSGGGHWEDPAVTAAVTRFVEAGGGLIGVDAPSHDPSTTTWRLAELFGVDQSGYLDEAAAAGCFTPNDRNRLGLQLANWTGAARRTAATHWLSEGGAWELSAMRANVTVRPLADDLDILYTGSSSAWSQPLVTARQVGRGRVAYFGGFAGDADYGALLRRAVFWTAGREDLYHRLHATPAGVLTYLYPDRKLLLVFNPTKLSVTASVQLDPALVGQADGGARLHDLLTNELVLTATSAALREGVRLEVGPRQVRCLELR